MASATATRFGLSRGLLGLQYDQINESESESYCDMCYLSTIDPMKKVSRTSVIQYSLCRWEKDSKFVAYWTQIHIGVLLLNCQVIKKKTYIILILYMMSPPRILAPKKFMYCYYYLILSVHAKLKHVAYMNRNYIFLLLPIADKVFTALTTNTIQFTKAYIIFCEDMLKVYCSNHQHMITTAFVDILTAQMKHIEKSGHSEQFKKEVMLMFVNRLQLGHGFVKINEVDTVPSVFLVLPLVSLL